MPKITVLPHATLCPEGAVIEDAPEGQTVLDVLLDHDIEVDHACAERAGRRPARPGMGLGSRFTLELSGSCCR